ncbi:UNVERIFIED_CONTAM: hypothetical protein Sangu_3234200, partial [Sesamum angustifolium]
MGSVKRKNLELDGEVTTFKARLVAKDILNDLVDFAETFSPVAMAKSIRILLAIAAWYDYEIWQMDVKTAFLMVSLRIDLYGSAGGIHVVGEEQK